MFGHCFPHFYHVQTVKQSNSQTVKQSNSQTVKQSNSQTVKYDLHKIIMLLLIYCTIKSQKPPD
ncbi:hypothetical protein C0159_07510 [Moraxella catarrhalis]|nr:hypothetical protein [Moraxella catarrhalis]MPX30977.1 hypothetical protein [Moraxella catarrhalis]